MTSGAQLGERIGWGGTCDVHEWGGGLVVKLFKPGWEYLASVELERASAVHGAGVPCPVVHDRVTVTVGRTVFDRVEGRGLGWPDGVVSWPGLHADRRCRSLLDSCVWSTRSLTWVDGLLDGDRIFDGDPHPGNVRADGDGWSVIDGRARTSGTGADVRVRMDDRVLGGSRRTRRR